MLNSKHNCGETITRGGRWLVPVALCFAATLGTNRAAAEDCIEWTRVDPDARSGYRAVWDTRRDVLVMFTAPRDEWDKSHDTWEWNGRRWRFAGSDGPSPRIGADMSYDEQRGVTVLFGGMTPDREQRLSDTWEWDGQVWTQRFVDGPSPRSHHAMAYDSDRGVTVLTGGSVGGHQYIPETWEYDGQTWTLRDAAQPDTQSSHRLVYDRNRRVMVAFGNLSDHGIVWEWDGQVWMRRETDGPTRREGHAFAYDARRGVSVVIGGNSWGGDPMDDVWEWDGATWTQRDPLPFEGRSGAAMVYDPRGTFVFVGGTSLAGSVLRRNTDIWEYSDLAWNRVHGSAPGGYTDAQLVYDAARHAIVLAGGRPENREPTSSVSEWNGRQWRERIADNPQSLDARQAAYDPHLRETVVLTGRDPIDFWTWRKPYWREYEVSNAPTMGGRISMTFDAGRSAAVIFNDDGETWEWDRMRDRLELRARSGPPPRTDASMAFDADRGVSVLFGTPLSGPAATWEWDGQAWAQVSVEGPGRVHEHTMTYDSRRGDAVFFGGRRDGSVPENLNEVWRWDGEQWRQLEPVGTRTPPPCWTPGFAYDAGRDVFVAYGGRYSDQSVWELGPVVCCDAVETLTTKCRKRGLVATLNLSTGAYDGRRITLIADGEWHDAKVRGNQARTKFTRASGSVEISLDKPSGCERSWQAECR